MKANRIAKAQGEEDSVQRESKGQSSGGQRWGRLWVDEHTSHISCKSLLLPLAAAMCLKAILYSCMKQASTRLSTLGLVSFII